jgi:hypothetical protein
VHAPCLQGTASTGQSLAQLLTCLLKPRIVQHLHTVLHFHGDAGRFVCNYTLYESLRQCQHHHHQQQQQVSRLPSEKGSWQAVFVHVPSFAVIPPERQLAFATDLLQLLALQPAAQPRMEDAGDGRQGSVQQLFGWLQQQKVPAMFAFLTTWFTLKTK